MGGGRGRVVVAEVDVDRLPARGDGGDERFVGRLAAAQVAERRRMAEGADAYGARLGESRLDSVPGGMLEIEREPQRRVERAEQQLQHSLVAPRLERDPHRAEPVA